MTTDRATSNDEDDAELLAVTTIRTLAMDAVEAAQSGHPGTAMAMAPVVYELWQNALRFSPDDPIWPDRDRFVLSIGHASMLLYALLHLTKVRAVDSKYEDVGEPSVTLDDIRRFRQLDSRCPGHPEYRYTTGVETTTGPLGQGVANSVGMAISAAWLAARYNTPEFPLFTHSVYALCGDGDMMEGAASEAASLAGHLKLANLCWIYDSNRISIEGATSLAFSEDVGARFAAYGWNVLNVDDANDLRALAGAFGAFKATTDRPTLIIVASHIGYGAPHKQDTSAAHGEPLGDAEVRATKRAYGWPEEPTFYVPDAVYRHFEGGIAARGRALARQWRDLRERHRAAHPQHADELDRIMHRDLPDGWDGDIPTFPADAEGVAGRDASARVLNAIAARVPWMLGGSADLAPSTKTRLTFAGAGDFGPDDRSGRNFHFGVREHAMGSILNGMALGKLRPFGSGFLIFSDYMKPPIRLSALMELPVTFIFTHDSIGVGEDGPTHQPVEQLAALRSIPGLVTLRPADANEVAEAWRVIMERRRDPACLVLSRQKLPTIDRSRFAPATGLRRGAYVLADPPSGAPEVILIGTGSEVALCMEAHSRLAEEGIPSRVVSMPSWELFERQDAAYRAAVLPDRIRARLAVEQAAGLGWERYVGLDGAVIAMRTFGASAPLKALLTKFGFDADAVLSAAREQVAKARTAG